jgi:phosphate-selective porin OprO/OprP
MGWRKLLARAAAIGVTAGAVTVAWAGETEMSPEVSALIRRLEAAEAEIRELKAQQSRQGTAAQTFVPIELGGIEPNSSYLNAPAQDDLSKRLGDLEKKFKSQEDAEAKKKSEFPTYKLIGRVHADSVWMDENDAISGPLEDFDDGTDFRRARIGLEGLLWENLDYRIEMDFAGSGRPSFTDVYATVKELPCIGNIRIGHYKEPFSLEELTSSRFITFMERSLPNAFAPARNLGISAFNYTADESITWALGWFRTASDEFGDDVTSDTVPSAGPDGSGEQSFTSRVTWNPYYDEGSGGRYLLHLGGAYSFRDADEGRVSFASTPEMRMRTSSTAIGGSGEGALPNFVSTGTIAADHYDLFGLEAAAVWGSFSVQAEYIAASVDQTAAGDAYFDGYYVYASYFLTGEHRTYNRRSGSFDRVKPYENFFSVCTEDAGICTGWGAWELKARYSFLDLQDSGIAGGELTDWTLGVNWYLNPNFRIMLDYVHADVDDGAADGGEADIIGMRASFDW